MMRQLTNPNLHIMVALDALTFGASLLLAYAIRFNFAFTASDWREIAMVLPWVVTVKMATFFLLGAYRGLWRYTSRSDAWRLLKASALASLVIIVGLAYFDRFEGYPRSVVVADCIFTCFLCGGIRIAIRQYHRSRRQASQDGASDTPHHHPGVRMRIRRCE